MNQSIICHTSVIQLSGGRVRVCVCAYVCVCVCGSDLLR